LRAQLARLDEDEVTFERMPSQVQEIAAALLSQTPIPSVKAVEQLLPELADGEWWVDVSLPLETARRRVRSLVRFVTRERRAVVYTNFADEAGPVDLVELPILTPGTNLERFRDVAEGFGRFVRSLVGLDREAAMAAFAEFSRGADFTANQLRFVQLVIEHLTASGVMLPERLFDSPFSDGAPQGPQSLFTDAQVGGIVAVLADVRRRATTDATVT
jgi:type I restriction enzyme R subunit